MPSRADAARFIVLLIRTQIGSRGHPPRAACALPAPAAYLPPTCRAGVHARRDPAQPGNFPAWPPALLRTPHPLPPRSPGPGRLPPAHL